MHKAQLILNAAFTRLETLVTNKIIKQTIRNRAIAPTLYPCISMSMGPDTILKENHNSIDSALEIYTDIYISSADSDLDKQTLEVRAEIHKVLLEVLNLDLPYVMKVTPLGQFEPEYDGESESYTSATRLAWSIQYRSNYKDPTI
jgi:hypothetical protein